MNIIKTITLSLFFLISIQSSYSNATINVEEKNKLSLDEGSIDSQFEYVIKKSHNYQDFEVIKKSWMHRLRSHVNDSLKLAASKLEESKTQITNQKAEITSLQQQLENTQGNLNQAMDQKNSMVIFGTLINKNFYNLLVWGIIAGLTALLIFFIGKFKSSNLITRQTKQEIEEIQYEYDSYRKRSLEREQVLARELQDERNKHLV